MEHKIEDVIDILNDFVMYNFDTELENVQDNGDTNIVYSTYTFKEQDDTDIFIIFNCITLTMRTIYTIYKNDNGINYSADYCVDTVEFSNIAEIIEYFDELDFDDLLFHGSKFEAMHSEQQPNWVVCSNKI